MYVLVNLWTPTQRWLDLSRTDRRIVMDSVIAATTDLADAGISSLGWGRNDEDTPHRAAGALIGIWRATDRSALVMLERTLETLGWYDYFEQRNVRAELDVPARMMNQLIDL